MVQSSYNTDGMYGMPVIEDDCFNSIERAIGFDVRDWSEDRRSAWIYAIVFGWDEGESEIKKKFSWTDEDISRVHKYHNQWEKFKSNFAKKKEGEQIEV